MDTRAAAFASLLVACARPPVATKAPPPATTPAFTLADGVGGVALQLDLDSVAQALLWDGHVVQRTPSGALVFRDPASFAVERIEVEPAPATTIGLATDALYAGFADGRIARVEPNAGVRYVGAVSAAPIWVGGAGGHVRAVAIGPLGPDRKASVDVWSLADDVHHRGEVDFSRTYGGTGPSAIAASDDALFLGWDWGEWGGALARIDLADASVSIDGHEGVYGLAKLSDGVWAFGGMMHLGMLASSLHRVEPAGGPAYVATEEPTPGGGPLLPITHVFEGKGTDERIVLAYSDVYTVDAALTRWTKSGTLDLLYRSGRPDAVGDYPSVTSAWLDARGRIVVGTRLQGFRTLGPDGKTAGPTAAEGTGTGFLRVVSTRDGLVVIDRDIVPHLVEPDGLRALPTRWEGTPYRASWDVDPDGRLRATLGRWDGLLSFGDQGELLTVVWSDDGAAADTLGPSPGDVSYVRASDGALLAMGRGEGWVETAGKWTAAPGLATSEYGSFLRAVAGAGHFFVMRDGGALWRWKGEGAASTLEQVREGVDHAVVLGDRLYVVEHGALAVLDPTTGAASSEVVPAPPGLRRLAADGCGRLWLAGDVLGVVESGRLRTFPDAPGLAARSWIDATGRPEGIALTDGDMVADVSLPCAAR